MEQDIKTQLLTKKTIDLLFQLSVPAVIGMIVMEVVYHMLKLLFQKLKINFIKLLEFQLK